MAPIVSTFEISRPPEVVYAFVTDPSRFPEWQNDVVRVTIQGDGPPGVGTRFATTRTMGRIEYTTVQEIVELNPTRRWAARGVDGPFRPSASLTVEPLGTGSLVSVALDFEGHGLGRLFPLDVIRRIAARSAPRSYRNLVDLLEGGA